MMRYAVIASALLAAWLAPPAGAAARPDLTVRTVKAPTAAAAGGTVTIQGAVRNAARGRAARSTLELVLSTNARRDARDTRIARVTIKALRPGRSATFKVRARIPATLAARRYRLLACADQARKIRETREGNNCRVAPKWISLTAPATPGPAPAPGPPAPAPIPSAPRPLPTPTASPVRKPLPPAITAGPAGTVTVHAATFAFTGDGPFECRLDAGAWERCTAPHTYAGLLAGRHTFDVRGPGGTARRDWRIWFEAPAPGPAGPAAPDPLPSAPAPASGEATLVGDSTAFLYTGPDPIQPGVAADAISPERAAVVRGRVQTRMATPIGGVRVSVLRQPRLGYTTTRADGGFDLAVNGDAPLTLEFQRAGYLPVQRTVEPAAQDYDVLDAVTLIPYDDAVTGVDLAGTPAAVQSTPVTDDAGTRRATLLFSRGTRATARLADGTRVELPDRINVRATEYTVGPTGPSAMPGELPPTSGYTYAVEYSVDEADALGAVDVRFDRPVAAYVDNFLDFAAGTTIPSGYYDRAAAAWVASENGIVITVTGAAGGLAVVDSGGVALDIPDEERRRLAQLFPAGKSLWRVPVTHFTPWDFNMPFEVERGQGLSFQRWQQAEPTGRELADAGCTSGGSIIGCEDQTLGEEIAVAGTPYMLRYASDRVPGGRSGLSIDIPLTGTSLPGQLKTVRLVVEVAGQRFEREFIPDVNLSHTFTWDGRDAYGRLVVGRRSARVEVTYAFPSVYQVPAPVEGSFGLFGEESLSAGNPGRADVELSREWDVVIGSLSTPPAAVGGWGLDVHHLYDPVGRTLYLGDGGRRGAEGQNFDVIDTVVGPTALDAPEGLASTPDGAWLVADTGANVVRRFEPDGTMTVVAGTGTAGDSGDGGPATAAALDQPSDIALAPDGAIYVADRGNHRVRRIDPAGVITTVAGTGARGYSGDGGRATAARLDQPTDVAVTVDGTVYVIDHANHALRRIGTDGVITAVAGNGAPGFGGDEGPARASRLRSPRDVAVAPDGSLYVADTGNHRVRRITNDGLIATVAGDGDGGYRGDGGLATAAGLDLPSAVAPTADGGFAVADAGNSAVRVVGSEGTIETVAGTGDAGDTGDGGPSRRARLDFPQALVAGPGAALTLLDAGRDRVRRVAPSLPSFARGDTVIPSALGDELYVFTPSGRHLRTVDALTGATLLSFGYDADGRLVRVTDDAGGATTLERDAAGLPVAIVGPYGHRTAIATDGAGMVSRVTDPSGAAVALEYGVGGLLVGLSDPRGGVHRFEYDSEGRLTRDDDGSGGVQTLAREIDAHGASTVTLTTAEGHTTSYRTDTTAAGELRRTVTDPAGAVTTSVVSTDGETTVTRPDGTRETHRFEPDPRFGMQVQLPATTTTELPSGLRRTTETHRRVELADPRDPLSLTRLVQTDSVNGRTSTLVYERDGRTLTSRSPSGAEAVIELDHARRPLRYAAPGRHPVTFAYDRGRIATRTQGARVWRYEYGTDGLTERMTDPLGRVTRFEYDAAGRAVRHILPGGQAVEFAHDPFGSIVGLTPPGRPTHALAYNSRALLTHYAAPGAEPQSLAYDRDGRLVAIDRPGTRDGTLAYDAGARLRRLSEPGREVTYLYDDATSRHSRIVADDETLEFAYDGPLLVAETFAGAASGTVERAYDDELRLVETAIDGEHPAAVAYDVDGLLVGAGALTLLRGPGGYVTATAVDALAGEHVWDAYGEPTAQTLRAPSGELYAEEVERDAGGLVTHERTLGRTATYERDTLGRLTSATTGDGTVTYTWDGNGNRLTRTAGGATTAGTYDAQDRLLQWGATEYEYEPSGELRRATTGDEVTEYAYDGRGNLLSVSLPDDGTVEYAVDGADRRVAVRHDGETVARYVYGDALGPAAEVDADGGVVTRFVYATRSNVPDLMIRDGVTYRLVLDPRGSVRLVVDAATGTVAQRLDYDEFGVVTHDSRPGFQPFGYAGGLYEPLTGLVRLGARDYDPRAGRFVAKDPLGFDGGSTNVYLYANGDPISFIDPSGQSIPLVIAVPAGTPGTASAMTGGIGPASVLCLTGRRSQISDTAVGLATFGGSGIVTGGRSGGATADAMSLAMPGRGTDSLSVELDAAGGAHAIGTRVSPSVGYQAALWRPAGPSAARVNGPAAAGATLRETATKSTERAEEAVGRMRGCKVC